MGGQPQAIAVIVETDPPCSDEQGDLPFSRRGLDPRQLLRGEDPVAAGLQRDDFAGLQLAVAGRIDLDHGLALTAGQGDLGADELAGGAHEALLPREDGLGDRRVGKIVGDAVLVDGDQADRAGGGRIAQPFDDPRAGQAQPPLGSDLFGLHQFAVLRALRGVMADAPFLVLALVDGDDPAALGLLAEDAGDAVGRGRDAADQTGLILVILALHFDQAAQEAVEKGVHAVGASSLAAGHLTLVPELKAELAKLGREDIMIVVGGVIPPSDVQPLLDMGAAAVYPPGSVIAETAADLIEKLNQRLGYAQPTPVETKK